MSAGLILNVVLIAVLLLAVLAGMRRGLLLSMCGLVAVLLACLGATEAQGAFTQPVAHWLQPKLQDVVENRLNEELASLRQKLVAEAGSAAIPLEDGTELTVAQLDTLLGAYGIHISDSLQKAAADAADETVESGIPAAARSITEPVATAAAGTGVYVLAFALILLACHLLATLLNLVDALPVVHTLNHTGGALFGLLRGGIEITVVFWLLLKLELVEPEQLSGPLAGLFSRFAQGLL